MSKPLDEGAEHGIESMEYSSLTGMMSVEGIDLSNTKPALRPLACMPSACLTLESSNLQPR
jgi:hypothetical protein